MSALAGLLVGVSGIALYFGLTDPQHAPLNFAVALVSALMSLVSAMFAVGDTLVKQLRKP